MRRGVVEKAADFFHWSRTNFNSLLVNRVILTNSLVGKGCRSSVDYF